MERTGETWLTVLQHKAQRPGPKEADTDALNDATHCEKAGNLLFVHIPQGGTSKCDAFKFIFLYQQRVFYSIVPQKLFSAITYQIKHYLDLSNCKFTRSILISATWWGSPCRRSSDDANPDWVHCLGSRCRVKWQTVLRALWSQRRRDVGCATATMATDANVVTTSHC